MHCRAIQWAVVYCKSNFTLKDLRQPVYYTQYTYSNYDSLFSHIHFHNSLILNGLIKYVYIRYDIWDVLRYDVLLPFCFFPPFSGFSVGSDRSFSILGLLGACTVCWCNQRHSPWKMAVFLMCLFFFDNDELKMKGGANEKKETGVNSEA